MPKKLILNPAIFPNPKTIGQGEYTAIHEILSSTAEEGNDDETPQKETEQLVRGILKEFMEWTFALLKELEGKPALIEEGED